MDYQQPGFSGVRKQWYKRLGKRRSKLFILAIILALASYFAFIGLAKVKNPIPPTTTPNPTVASNLPANPSPVEGILKKIAYCESGNRQFDASGKVIRGRINHDDIGRFQVNLKYHQARATAMGLDLFTDEGNTKYALWLYQNQGTSPWNWSKPCWTSIK